MKTKRAILMGSVVFALMWTAQSVSAIDMEPYFPLTVGTARLYLETIIRNAHIFSGYTGFTLLLKLLQQWDTSAIQPGS